MEPKIRRNSRLLPVLIGALIIMQLINPYRGWAILLAGLGGAWLISYLWARSLAQNLHLLREMRFGWWQVGDRLEERFTLVNRGLFPGLWVEIHDQSTMPGYSIGRVAGVGGNSRARWQTQGVCTRRGLFNLGPTTLVTGDPFGFYSVTIQDPASTTLFVMPPIISLPNIQVAPGGRAGEGPPRRESIERSVSAATVREYVPGDDRRLVHWRTSARKNELYVRLMDSTPSSQWWILVDLDPGVKVGEGQNSTIEHGVILAASLADRGLREGKGVGLVLHSGRDIQTPIQNILGEASANPQGASLIWMPPQEGNEHRWELLRALALVEAGGDPLRELLVRIRPDLGKRSSLIIITPNVHANWLEALLPIVWSGTKPTVLLLDPVSYGGLRDSRAMSEALNQWQINHYVVSREMFDQPEARPGKAGHWDWRITPTGRAIPVRRPDNLEWKGLR